MLRHKSINGGTIARNTFWNLLGEGLPIAIAIFTIPIIITNFGKDRFGVLTIAWAMIGYFSIFDLGLGRAMTKKIAELLGLEKEGDLDETIWTGFFLLFTFGTFGMVLVLLSSKWIVYSLLTVPEFLRQETLNAFYLIAFSIPIVVSTTGTRGILEAFQRFDMVNAVKLVLGLYTFLSPLVAIFFAQKLLAAVAMLLIGRIFAWFVYIVLCLRIIPRLKQSIKISKKFLLPLLSFGSYMSISNVIGPVMMYFDRFFIGSIVSIAAVAYYTTPFEVINRIGVIPGALVRVLFPAFSTVTAKDPYRIVKLFSVGLKLIFCTIFPMTLIAVVFSHEGLSVWLGHDFAEISSPVLQLLAIGVFINSLAKMPFALLQGVGRPDITARIHLCELPFFILAVWYLTETHGITGTAVAWTLRMLFDLASLSIVTVFILPSIRVIIFRVSFFFVVSIVLIITGAFLTDLSYKLIYIIISLVLFIAFTWNWLFSDDEKIELRLLFRLKFRIQQ